MPGRAWEGVVGKAPVVELTAHQALVVDALVEDGGGGQEQKTHAYRAIAGDLPSLL